MVIGPRNFLKTCGQHMGGGGGCAEDHVLHCLYSRCTRPGYCKAHQHSDQFNPPLGSTTTPCGNETPTAYMSKLDFSPTCKNARRDGSMRSRRHANSTRRHAHNTRRRAKNTRPHGKTCQMHAPTCQNTRAQPAANAGMGSGMLAPSGLCTPSPADRVLGFVGLTNVLHSPLPPWNPTSSPRPQTHPGEPKP